MAVTFPGSSKIVKLGFYKQLLSQATLLLVFLGFLYEFPASTIMGVWASYGIADSTAFIENRLLFEAVFIAVSGLNVLVNYRSVFKVKALYVYVFILVYMITVVWLNRDEYAFHTYSDIQSTSAVDYWLPLFFKYIFFFLMGLYLLELRAFRYIIFGSGVFAAIVVLQNVDYEILGFNRANFVTGADLGIYLFLGDAFSITALLILANTKTNRTRFVFFLVFGSVVFLIGSRTSFIVFVFVVLLYFLLLFRIKWLPYYLVLCALILGVGSTLDFAELADKNPRMINVFTDFDEDSSVVARRLFAEKGWEDIRSNPVFGRFGGQRDSDRLGTKEGWQSYMHNIFSYWRQFGIFVFIALGYMYFKFILGVANRLNKTQSVEFRTYMMLGAFIIVESLFSRSFAFTVTHIIFGMMVHMYAKKPTGAEFSLSNTTTGLGSDRYSQTTGRKRRKRKSKRRFSF